jgi:hypothetical protein
MECPNQFSLELVKATTWTFHIEKVRIFNVILVVVGHYTQRQFV